MKLWKIVRNDFLGYVEYAAIIVAAETEEEALKIHPDGSWDNDCFFPTWSTDLTISYLGEAKPELPSGIILSSFNAG